jgi:hypothetical protein
MKSHRPEYLSRSKMAYPIKVSVPPAIMRGCPGQTYIVAGCMIPVPDNIAYEDMSKYVTYECPTYNDIKTWKVPSSSGSTYTVKLYDGSRYTCECAGFKFYKKCKHIKSVSS